MKIALGIISGVLISVLLASKLAVAAGQVEQLSTQVAALKSNGLGTPTKQEVSVYIPPKQKGRELSVVYWLLDFNQDKYVMNSLQPMLDEYFKAHPEAYYMIVAVPSLNKLGGSFYLNSELTGLWQDYTVFDLPFWIEQHYNLTITERRRGVAGFGMGGLGALNISLQYANVFGVAFSAGPTMLQSTDFKTQLTAWPQPYRMAYGASVAPISGEEYGQYPNFDGSEADLALQQLWMQGIANWPQKIDLFYRLGSPLSLWLENAESDPSHQGSAIDQFHQQLTLANFEHQFHRYPGTTKALWPNRFEQALLPYFTQTWR
ncbi:alpha/beta hydrolase-fold protein [Motilimonas pumila]|uniref:Esterase family protein n=1 Tax=Motilimonas pumila TaxID=2303987 RepID=A0A418YHF0_9GAMM|nr:alpha/beta hydrolase-fold protein [Motilimonas pumila]RJG49522.1 hypothetical protein D1Z90_06075 [Motilimonas pumila]